MLFHTSPSEKLSKGASGEGRANKGGKAKSGKEKGKKSSKEFQLEPAVDGSLCRIIIYISLVMLEP